MIGVVEKTLLLSSDCTKQSNFTNPISDGTLLAPESDNTQLHALFGQTWKVRNESDWLFRHTLSLVESDLEEGPVNAVYEVPPEFAASVNQSCNYNPNCILDVFLTDDVTIADDYAAVQQSNFPGTQTSLFTQRSREVNAPAQEPTNPPQNFSAKREVNAACLAMMVALLSIFMT
ncbi:uncharacterized protein LOC134848605 [Symsagittifera roscoffensis]|uniref:uncharacterized protein LOC134848605 n=1 Tax=Symsagittifera roscoffensis TaxID=84072 RepID=UPI00307B9AA5